MTTCFRRFVTAALAAALCLPAAASAGELTLTLGHGRATLIARDVPLRQILAEWARLGQTTIVNGDRLTGPPLTLHLVDRPEREVLEVLLKSASGYIAAQRPVLLANASVFDRVMILPTSRGPVGVAAAPPPPFNRPNAPPQMQQMPPPMVDDDEPMEPNVPTATPPLQNQPGPPFPNMPVQPQGQVPGGPPPVLTAPRPGMLPAPPGNPAQPYGAPAPNVRPPGAPPDDPDR